MARPTARNVDEYISWFPEKTQKRLEEVRMKIQKLVPEAEETISYAIPAFKLNKTYLVYYACFEKHIGMYPVPVDHPDFKDDFAAYKTGKGSVQFPHDKPLPWPFITRIIKHLLQENKKRALKKK